MRFLLLFVLFSFPAWAIQPPSLPLDTPGGSLPTRAQRIQAFERAGLLGDTAGMDELDQDLLYMRARRAAAKELRMAYPRLPAAKLVGLQSLVREAK